MRSYMSLGGPDWEEGCGRGYGLPSYSCIFISSRSSYILGAGGSSSSRQAGSLAGFLCVLGLGFDFGLGGGLIVSERVCYSEGLMKDSYSTSLGLQALLFFPLVNLLRKFWRQGQMFIDINLSQIVSIIQIYSKMLAQFKYTQQRILIQL